MPTHKQKMVARRLVRREIDPSYTPNNTEIVQEIYKYDRETASKATGQVLGSIGVIAEVETLREKFDRRIPDNLLVREYKTCLKSDNLPIKLRSAEIGFKMKGALSDSPINIDARRIDVNSNQIGELSDIISSMKLLSDKMGLNKNAAQGTIPSSNPTSA